MTAIQYEKHGTLQAYRVYGCRCEKCRKKIREDHRSDYWKHLERGRANKRVSTANQPRYIEDPVRRRARRIIENELRQGRLVRPNNCTECGSDPGLSVRGGSLIWAWCDDPTDPLTHDWICSRCFGARRLKSDMSGSGRVDG